MAYEGTGIDLSFDAGEDLSSYQYCFVHLADDDTVDLLDSTAEIAIGILQNAPASGEVAVVRVTGVSKLKMNDAIAVGLKIKAEYVSASDNGKGDAADTDYDNVRAMSLTASGAEDDVISVILCFDTLMVA